jgi:hypothetical protein
MQGRDVPRASLPPTEPDVVAEVHAYVPHAATQPGAGGQSQIASAAAECHGASRVRKGRLAAQRAPELEVKEAAGAIPPGVLPPVRAAVGLPGGAVGEGDTAFDRVAVSTRGEPFGGKCRRNRPAICDRGSRQTPRTEVDHQASKPTLSEDTCRQRVEPHGCEGDFRRRIRGGKHPAEAGAEEERCKRRRSEHGDAKRRHHLEKYVPKDPRGPSPADWTRERSDGRARRLRSRAAATRRASSR